MQPGGGERPANEKYQGHRCPRYVNYLNEPTEFAPYKLFYAYPD